ncbi:hypothetical protein T07_14033 [Trichinella nelsoni]|uniref:Uncharacterized protein n=1 Tax=Trichinella nelsoni TaxID=6336 RepID=A0A0V0S3Z6_9BILA|nr:hypothetical protein T07_14033 [Trichinella nelsoni]
MQQLAIACCQHPAVHSFVMWWGQSVIDRYDLHPEREDYLLVPIPCVLWCIYCAMPKTSSTTTEIAESEEI